MSNGLMRAARRGRDRRASVGIVVAPLMIGMLLGCSSPPSNEQVTSGTTSTGASATATQANRHQRNLSQGETTALTAELVTVPGYTYRDVPEEERSAHLATLPDEVTAAAFHAVTDTADGQEIAFLALAVPPPMDAMHAPGNGERFGQQQLGTSEATARTFSGQQVWFAEGPSRPDSRYQYTWLRHGTVAWLDGPDQEPLEKFLAAYFAVPFRGAEDPVLAARMVDLPGYAVTNAVDRTKEQEVAEELFPGATASMHYVFDQTHSFAGLVLVGPVQTVRDDELPGLTETWLAKTGSGMSAGDFEAQPEITVGDVTIKHVRNPSANYSLYVWHWPNTNIVGWLATTRSDLAEPFLSDFVSSQPAPVGR